jgi:hypothetical protein
MGVVQIWETEIIFAQLWSISSSVPVICQNSLKETNTLKGASALWYNTACKGLIVASNVGY